MTSHAQTALAAAGHVLRVLGRILERLVIGIGSLAMLAALLAGVPWGLIHFIGWPLPDHMPAFDEVITWLFHGTLDTDTLLDILAIVSWIAWGLFLLDVLASVVEAARGVRWPEVDLPTGPGRQLAAIMIGGLLWALIGSRDPTPATASATAMPGAWSPVVATAPQHPGAGRDTRTVTVADPVAGQHDSLWRIAERHLGDGHRWTEIWELNKHRLQNDGRMFTEPDLIQPGWTLDVPRVGPGDEPDRAHPRAHGTPDRADSSDAASPTGEPTSPPSTTARPAAPAAIPTPGAPASPDAANEAPATEAVVAFTLAAGVSAALVIARHRYRRRRGPGSDMPVAPFAYDLHLAHLRAEAGDLDDPDTDDARAGDSEGEIASVVVTPPVATTETVGAPDGDVTPGAVTPSLGIRDGVQVALDLAATRGLGLIGDGAAAAARALLVATLAEHPGDATLLVPADDLPALLGPRAGSLRLPASLRVAPTLDDALAELEALTVQRAHQDGDHPGSPVLLIARTPHDTRRLTAVLANGARYGIVGVFLGQYPERMCGYVTNDGTITATPPGAAERLRGTRLYHLPTQAAEVIDLLRQAEPNPAPAHLERSPAPGIDAAGNGHHDPAAGLTILDADGDPAVTTPDHPEDRSAPSAAGTEPDRGADDPGTPTEPDPVAQRAAGTNKPRPVEISVFGPVQVLYRPDDEASAIDITDTLGPKQAELLVLLALRPDGATRTAIADTIWPKHTKGAGNVFSTTLSRLRAAITSATDGTARDAVLTSGGRYRLNPDVVTVDYWAFAAAQDNRRIAATDADRAAADHAIIDFLPRPTRRWTARRLGRHRRRIRPLRRRQRDIRAGPPAAPRRPAQDLGPA